MLHTDASAADDQHPRDARPLTLDTRAVSPEGRALVGAIWAMVEPVILSQRKTVPGAGTTAKRRLAAMSIVAGVLLNEARHGRRSWSWQRLSTDAFTGQAVSKDHFRAAFDTLRGDLGMIEVSKAFTRFHGTGADVMRQRNATRLRATKRLHELAEMHGAPDGMTHFKRERPTTPPEPVILNPPSGWIEGKRVRGERLSLPTTGAGGRAVAQQRQTVEEANAFIRGFTITGCDPIVFQRKFTRDMWGHGRWYAFHSTMPKEDRRAIRIDGEEVAEVDVHASFLWVTFPRAEYTPPERHASSRLEGDLYTFGGLDRDSVKAWITATFGAGKPLKRWAVATLEKTPSLGGIDCGRVGAVVLARYPFLADLPRIWGCPKEPRTVSLRVMYNEAEALTDAMETMRHGGLPALPLHDSLIVRRSHVHLAKRALMEAYERRFIHAPVVRVT
jgi:hypothetical protein